MLIFVIVFVPSYLGTKIYILTKNVALSTYLRPTSDLTPSFVRF